MKAEHNGLPNRLASGAAGGLAGAMATSWTSHGQ